MKVILYSADDIASMRVECSAHEYDALSGSGDLSSFLYDGCVGWKHMPEKGVIDYWEANIGSSEDDGPSGEAEEGSEWGSEGVEIGGGRIVNPKNHPPRPDDEDWTDNPEAVQDAIREGREDERTGYQRRDGN